VIARGDSRTSSVFIVRDGRLKRIPVKVAANTGVRAEILSGLQPDDLVVVHPMDDLADGQAVQAVNAKDEGRSRSKSGSSLR
jgi:hypothetical protein